MTAWLGHIKAKRIIIVDDDVYNDEFLKQVLLLAAPLSTEVVIFNVEKMAEKFKNNNDEAPTILLFKSPLGVLKLLESGADLKNVDIGNMGAKPGRNKICKNVYANESELELFEEIQNKGCKLFIHMLPNDPVITLNDYLKI
jgi:PTS system mannose-specific IIB component